jgi:hypothetical protein
MLNNSPNLQWHKFRVYLGFEVLTMVNMKMAVCSAMLSGRSLPTFQRSLLPASSGWWWWMQGLFICTGLHDQNELASNYWSVDWWCARSYITITSSHFLLFNTYIHFCAIFIYFRIPWVWLPSEPNWTAHGLLLQLACISDLFWNGGKLPEL